MENYSSALKYAETAQDSNGSSLKKMSVYQESVESKSKKLTASLEGLSTTFLNSSFVKGGLDISSGLVGGLTKIIDTLGTIPTLAGAASIALSAMGKQQIFGNQNGSISFLGKTVQEMKQASAEGQKFGGLFTKQVVQPFANAESVINKYNLGLKNNSLTQKGFQRLLEQSDESLGGYLTGLKGAPADVSKYTTSLNTSKVSTVGLTVATTAMNMAMTMGIAALISLAVMGIGKLITYQQDCIDKANELTSTYKEQQKTITDNVSTIQGLNGEFEKLSKGVDNYGNNIALSTEEYKRYQEIVSQILGISPKLVTGYTAEGKAIADKNSLIERSIEVLKQEQKQKLLDMTTEDKNWDIAKGVKSQISQTQSELDNLSLNFSTSLREIFNTGFLDDADIKKKSEVMAKAFDIKTDETTNNTNLSSFYVNYQKTLMDNSQKVYETMLQNTDIFTEEDIKKFKDYISEKAKLSTDVGKASTGYSAQLQLIAQTADGYDKLTDAEKSFVTDYTNNIKLTGDETKEQINQMSDDLIDLVDKISASDTGKANINSLFSLDKSKMSAGEYQKQADVLIDIIAKEFEMNPVDLKVQLGMDSVDTLINEAKKKVNTAEINSAYTSQQASDKSSFVEGLSEDDLKILVKMGDIGSMSIEEITKAIDNAKKATGGLEDKTVKSADELEKEYEKANKAVSDFSSNASSIATVMKTISDGEKVDANTLLDLIAKYPQYASEIIKVNNSKEDGIAVAKLLFEANKTQTLAELEHQQEILKGQRDLLAAKVEYSNQPLETNTDWVEANNKFNAGQTSIDVVKGSNFEDFQKKDTGKKSDPNQDAYEKAMANHIHLHNMQLESNTDFYNAMEQANETYYKNDVDHLKDYNTNIETIYNGRNDIIKQAFEDEKTILQDANSGSIADQKKYLETLSKLNDEYYKGKTQFGKEYIATQKEIAKGQADLIKQENESQMDFVSSLKDKFDKSADDKINALKKQNEEVDKQLEKQQHLLDLQEKEIALKHAEENPRMVVGDNGIEYRTNPDDIKNAELDVAKAKQVIEQDKVNDQISALESVKENGDAIYDVLLEMYKALTGKDVTPVKSNPEVEARLAQATTIDKDGNTLVNGMPITPLNSNIKDTFDKSKLDLSGFNRGNLNMGNLLNNSLNGLDSLGAVTNNNSTRTQSVLYNFNGANFNLPNVQNGRSFEKELITLLPNATAQINGKK